uniref:Uncharacterized protein n=1 Tax=Rhizophora mucronata TaxID=61149 RepID=A0A2P2QE53_RHIMU
MRTWRIPWGHTKDCLFSRERSLLFDQTLHRLSASHIFLISILVRNPDMLIE